MIYDYRILQAESAHLRARYMAEHQETLRSQVDRVIGEIELEKALQEQQLIVFLKERANEAFAIAENLVNQNNKAIDKATLEKLVKDSLRNIRFNDGRGYFFAVNMNGTEELFPTYPKLEGRDLSSQQNSEGRFVVAEMLTLARTAGEGFIRYTWNKPDKPEKKYPKIAYIKFFPDLDWIIGTGEYLDDATANLQEKIVRRIEQIRFGNDKKEYLFVGTWDGLSKTFPAKGKNMLETRDASGVYIVKTLIEKAKAGGGFVEYVMPMIDGVQSKPKLSYAAAVPEWQWYVGAGIYIDEIDTIIAKNQRLFKDKVGEHLKIMLLVLACLLVIYAVTSHFISRNIWRQIDMFSKFLRRASSESISLDSDILTYREFREIGTLANKMLQEKNSILQEISLSRDEWAKTFDAIGDCVMLLDGDGKIVRANKAAVTLHGIAAVEIFQMSFADLCGNDNPVKATLIDNLPHTAEIEAKKMNKMFLASSFPILSGEGKLERIIHIAHDITEQKRLKERISQSQKMEAIGTLAGGIAHDFNNILAAILGNAELAQQELTTGSRTEKHLQQILAAGNRAKDLVRQILAFSRPAKAELRPLQPAATIQETLKLLRSSLPATITIEQDIDANTGLILADPTRIHQIVMNLCTNAYHAMEETGGTLHLALKGKVLAERDLAEHPDVRPGKFVQLTISDNGSGIAPDVQTRIFDPFFTTKETGKGTGMGLAIVHSIVKNYGGFLTFSSQPGKGTVFHVNLPEIGEYAPLPENRPPELPAHGTERILYVDDEMMLAEMFPMMLKHLGYQVTTRTSGLEALALFKNGPEAFDLVITDQTMPGMTGVDMAREMLRIRPNLPIILCTGYSSTVSAEKARAIGIKSFVQKPLTEKDIAATIRQVLDDDSQPKKGTHKFSGFVGPGGGQFFR